LIDLESTARIQKLLQDAVSKLREERIEEAITIMSKAREEIIKQISLGPIRSDAYALLYQVSALTYFAMLHYIALAKKKAENSDDATKLTYLSESLGISNVLDGILFPLLSIDDSRAMKEFCDMIRPGESCREELCKEIAYLINKARYSKGEKIKEYNESIKKIIEAVNPGSLEIRNLALQLGRRFEAGDFKQARRIYEYVRDEIHYMRDPLPFEDIQSPEVTLGRLSGDCEDQAILLCSLLLAIGFETALFFADTDGDGLADHVYSGVHLPNAPEIYKTFANKKIGEKDLHHWIPLDPTSEDLDFGIITFDNLEIKHAFLFAKDGQYLVNEKK
jgi:hypothetical protein